MKALVTGRSGFIGSDISETLVKRGDKVRVLDHLSTGTIFDFFGQEQKHGLGLKRPGHGHLGLRTPHTNPG
jgi:NAD(P)-dependent dehydrogenase (short-subunit alcohol dehydrogenase family)